MAVPLEETVLHIGRGGEHPQGPALGKVGFCLDQLERGGFADGVRWETEIAPNLTLEELVGALVVTEKTLIEMPICEECHDVIDERLCSECR